MSSTPLAFASLSNASATLVRCKCIFFDEIEDVIIPNIHLDDAPAAGKGLGEALRHELGQLMADVVAAYVNNNPVPVSELPALIASVAASLNGLVNGGAAPAEEPQKPAVSIKKSVTPDYIISLETGKQFKSLKRHLMTSYGMTPDEYRAKWNLPSVYRMVAPNYAAARSEMAKAIRLGRKPAEKPKAKPTSTGAKRVRKKAAA